MKQSKVLSVLVGATVLLGFAGSVFAAPLDLEITHRDSTDATDVAQNVSPYSYNGDSLMYFHGTGTGDGSVTTGNYSMLNVGSGIGILSGNIFVTPATIETTDGHLSDTLGIINGSLSLLFSEYATDASTIAGLGSPFNIAAFMGNSASTTPFIASSSPGFMSGAMVTKLSALNASSSIAYEGTTQRVNSFPIFKSATVASGVAVFNLTADGTSGGTALCTNGVIQDSVNANANDATASYQWSYAFSNSNKTVTITVNKLTTANILTGLLGQSAANGAIVKMSVYCY